MVKKHYPDYELAADHLSHYRDMKLVTFAVDQEAHSLIVAFPAFIKDYRKPPLSMFEIEQYLFQFQTKTEMQTVILRSTYTNHILLLGLTITYNLE